MLPRTLSTSLRRTTSLVLGEACTACTCRCGAPLNRRPDNGSHNASQKRSLHASQPRQAYQTARKSPSTLARNNRRRALTPEEARRRHGVDENGLIEKYVEKFVLAGGISVSTEAAMGFLRAFEEILAKARGRPGVEPGAFTAIKEEYALSERDCFELGRLLIHGVQDERFTGRKLLISLSRAGDVETTLYIMANAVQQQKTKPGTLNSVDVQYPRAQLAKIAAQGTNFRAMVLEGKLALALGDEERAIDLWTKAMAAAVEAAEEEERSGGKAKMQLMADGRRRDQFQLDSPWIELMLLHYERSKFRGKEEWSQCQWAIEIGCQQDDPVSHYYASTFTKRVDGDGNHMPESAWLYHITKAATSGHQKAMHELGEFYAQSGWKYINDEPPDHLKPTPFDSHPPHPFSKSWADILKSWFGIHNPKITKPSDHIFQSAAFPNTARDRWELAIQWLEEACKYTYAPSFLLKAQLYMQKTLWSGADAPPYALTLRPERYDYNTGEQYQLNGPASHAAPAGGPRNPYYSPETAKDWLRQVFYAHQAHGYAAAAQAQYASRRRRGLTGAAMDEDDIVSEYAMTKLPFQIRKWFRFPEVREMYEGEMESLLAEAKSICDEQGWDLVDDVGGLVYKAVVKKG